MVYTYTDKQLNEFNHGKMFIVPIQNMPSERVTKLLLLRLKIKVKQTP